MNVRTFKKLVSSIPESQDDWIVVISIDDEGNGFKELFDIDRDNNHVCTRYFDEPSNELCFYNDSDYKNFDEFEKVVSEYEHLKPCIVLWP